MRFWCVSALILALAAFFNVENAVSAASCGYASCPKTNPNMLNVHLVPHTHDDVGWLKTADQYYYGSKTGIQRAGVQYILDSVVAELLKDKTRRFIYVESAYFSRWYFEQPEIVRKNVKKLVNEGRLEFVGGAWSMNDEAAVHYQAVIDQFTLGLKTLDDIFGECARPRIGWQIDPFGHSREMASIFSQMSYDGEFLCRFDWVEKKARMSNLTSEMIWKATDNLDERSEIFAGLLYNEYASPPGFCFDTLCKDEPIIDGKSYDNNVKERVNAFIDYVEKMSLNYRASHIMVPMGEDFYYENAGMNFKNMDKLIKYVNERQALGQKVNVFYSTPSCYLNSLHKSSLTWPNKTQDFFPYSTDAHTYWTGYYSSRPTQKKFERDGNHFLQVTKQLTTLANLTSAVDKENLDALRQVMGVMQHHDAITGTEKQHVSDDYDRMLTDGLVAAQNNARSALRKLTNLTNGEFESCLLLNISACHATYYSANNLVVTVYNPLAHRTTQYIRLPVKSAIYEVVDEAGYVVPSQMIQVPKEVLALTFRPNFTQHELIFQASVDKIASYYVKTKPRSIDEETESNRIASIPARFHQIHKKSVESAETLKDERAPILDTIVRNELISLNISSTGHLVGVTMNKVSHDIRQDFYYYPGAVGNNYEAKNRSSGAYIFRPSGNNVMIGPKVNYTIYEGDLCKEVHQVFNEYVSQVIRICKGVNMVEFEWLVGPLPINDNVGREIITRFTSNLNNGAVFYTDSNGREMMQRTRNQREYYKPDVSEQVSSNYYPVTARIALEDKEKRLTLLNDRAQGGSSLRNGEIEMMVHRRLLHDDAFGVGESLNETAYGKGLIARGKTYLILSPVSGNPTIAERLAQQQIHLPLWKFFSNSTKATNKVIPKIPSFDALPISVDLLTLEPFDDKTRLLRFEHIFNRGETGNVTFNIRDIFDSLGGEDIKEYTLDGNMKLKNMKRFKFQPDGSGAKKVEYYTSPHTPLSLVKKDARSKFDITLTPMQIRTFIITWK